MSDISSSSLVDPVVHLGIRGMPNLTDSLISGGLYAFVAETPPARFPILAGSLCSAFDSGMVCTVITPSSPEQLLERLESFGTFLAEPLIAANRLNVFETQEDFPKKMFRFGTESFVSELEQFDIPENSFILFDQADELLALHDISLALDQINILRPWFEQRRVTALLVFSRGGAAHAATINALMDNLTGITRLGGNRNGLELTFDYWQSSEGAIAAKTYRLQTLDSGFYEVSSTSDATDPAIDSEHGAEDAEPRYFYMDPDLTSLAQQLPGIWQRVDSLVGMMHATHGARSATLILSFHRDTRIRQLAEAVHSLRLSLGRRTRIAVQEKGASLRYQNEALLLRLGVNLIVHRDVTASRLPLLLESLHGQIFNRDVNINFEAALASVLPTRSRGYLQPPRFVREVEGIMDRADNLNIPYALIVGKPASGKTMAELISSSSMSRPGDVLSADRENCFLFLNACPQPVLLLTLQRILGVSIEEALEDPRFVVRREDILNELSGLTRAAQDELPDYSALAVAVSAGNELAPTAAPQETGGTDLLPDPIDTYSGRLMSGRLHRPATQQQVAAVQQVSPRMPEPVPAAPAKVVPAALPRQVPQTIEKPQFTHDNPARENPFGKKSFPRAVRSTANASARVQADADAIDSGKLKP